MLFLRRVMPLTPQSLLDPLRHKKRSRATTTPLLVFTFDDGNDTDYTKAFPLMQSLGIKGTSYINTDLIGRLSDRLTWTQIQEMHQAGWDFQCHTHTHARLTELDENGIRQELESLNNAFALNDLPIPQHHAYPYGSTNAFVQSIVSEYRLTRRHTGAYGEGDLNSYNTLSPELRGVGAAIQDEIRFATVKNLIDIAIRDGKIIVLYAHRIIPEPGDTYHILESYFEDLCDYIANTGIETLTISELYERVFSS